MEAFFVRSIDPQGGYIDLYRAAPAMEHERRTVVEVRKGDFPAETWMKLNFGELSPDPSTHFDTLFQPYYDKAEVWWTREGGFTSTHGS